MASSEVAGDERTAKSKVLETGAGMTQVGGSTATFLSVTRDI